MCRAALPAGLTPEHVREKRAAQRLRNRAAAQQNAIVGAAARAREAVRAHFVRGMVNRPAGAPSVPAIEEEHAVGEMPPWMSPPRGYGGIAGAPATPARTRSTPIASTSTDMTGRVFITAAEELRRTSEASRVASSAFTTASAPSTPARGGGGCASAAGTISSVLAEARRGPGNAGTLDGLEMAEEDRRSRAVEARRRRGRERDDDDLCDRDVSASGDGDPLVDPVDAPPVDDPVDAPPVETFGAPNCETNDALARAAETGDALVAQGTASAPATPSRYRPAVAAAMAAAATAAAEGDELGGERARRVMQRLAVE
jgi:hypothetical protein